jgi:hypothetical protein
VVQEWRAEGAAEMLLRLLERRLGAVSEDLAGQIRACQKVDQLGLWLDVASEVSTLEEFRKRTNLGTAKPEARKE